MTMDAASWMDEVMTDASWARRVAGALLGDPTAADDALQDAWVKSGGTRLDNQRGWVRTVVANALRDRRRGEQRRRKREEAAMLPAAAISPEELLGRLEVHKTLARLVTDLDEPARQVVLLHYFEGLSLVQIASMMGAPPGTVRWRLMTALERLRERLEKRYGDERRDWRAVLSPLLAPPTTAAPVSPAPNAAPVAQTPNAAPARPAAGRGRLWAGAVAAAVVATAIGVALRRSPATRPAREAASAAGEEPPRSGGRPPMPRGPRARPVALAATALPVPCPQEEATRTRDLEAARNALDYYLSPKAIWSDAGDGPNLRAKVAIEPVVGRVLDDRGAPAQGRSLECRATSCLATVIEPWPPTPSWVNHQPSDAAARALDERARTVQLTGPERKPRPDGSAYAETTLWIRLNDPSGAPARAAPPPFPSSLLPSGGIAAPDSVAGRARTEECRARLAELDRGVETLRRRAVREVAAEVLYDRERRDPALTGKLQQKVDGALARAATNDSLVQLAVDCRGVVCQIAPPQGARIPEQLVRDVVAEIASSYEIERGSFSNRNGRLSAPGYLVLSPRGAGREGKGVLKTFLMRLHDEVEDCRQRFTAVGSLTARFVLPGTGEVNDDGIPARISFRLSGPAAGSPLAACLQERIAAAAAGFTVPPGVSRADASKTIDLKENP
jgi:RNA polymerase sigma factor (sigma-70 family)